MVVLALGRVISESLVIPLLFPKLVCLGGELEPNAELSTVASPVCALACIYLGFNSISLLFDILKELAI
jgi:hypothetical protein